MIELKPCPFCGGGAHLMKMGWPHWVYCESCGAKVHGRPPGDGAEKASIAAWNRRVDFHAGGQRWISVVEALPEPYETVLISVLTRNGYGEPAKYETIGGYDYNEKRWRSFTGRITETERVMHWQPMPESPKEEVENV